MLRPYLYARAKLYMEAGADAIFPKALNTAEMFRAFAERIPGAPLRDGCAHRALQRAYGIAQYRTR